MQGTLRGALLLALLGAGSAGAGRPRPGTVNRHIILVDDEANLESCTEHAVTCGAEIHRVLPLMNGFVCTCPGPAAVRAIMGHPAVEAVEPDTRVPLPRVSAPLLAPPPARCVEDRDLVPWGIDRIGTLRAWRRSRGEGVKVAVIDTGVDTRHPDLLPNLRGGVNLLNPGQAPDDDSGHGTHVAGILAAADNCSGVVGVAPRCELYAVKAFDRHGLGATSDVLTALQWCADYGMQVVKATCCKGSNAAAPLARRVTSPAPGARRP